MKHIGNFSVDCMSEKKYEKKEEYTRANVIKLFR